MLREVSLQTFLGMSTPSGGFGICLCLRGLRYVIFLKFETLNMSTSNDLKILGKSRGQNLQNLIKLNVL